MILTSNRGLVATPSLPERIKEWRMDGRNNKNLDDQMSAWTVTDNHFTDCHVCSFIGGGRRNVVANNRFVRCGTVQYFNNQ